jgi:hypothetical protein
LIESEMLAAVERDELARDRGRFEKESDGARDVVCAHGPSQQGRAALPLEIAPALPPCLSTGPGAMASLIFGASAYAIGCVADHSGALAMV